MPRKYVRRFSNVRKGKTFKPYRLYNEETFQTALEQYRKGTLKLNDVEDKFGIPRSTFARLAKKGIPSLPTIGPTTIFTVNEEAAFVEHLNTLAKWGFPCQTIDFRIMVRDYLNKKGVSIPQFRDNTPGQDWVRNFLARHKQDLTARNAANISTKRAELSLDSIENFFKNASDILSQVQPDNLINYDETNMTDNPKAKRQKFIVKRGCKYPERVINSSKASISVMFAGTASGHLLPPYVVYKSEHLWDTWTRGGPPGTRYNRSKSGWFDLWSFEDWFISIILPYFRGKDGLKVVVGDNLSSHFNERILNVCREQNIHFICLPPNATHVMQPLDVAFYGPLKHYWGDILTKWKMHEGRRLAVLSKDAFPSLLSRLYQRLEQNNCGSNNLVSGFRKCGLFPVDPSKPKARIPSKPTVQLDDPSTSSPIVSEVVINMLSELRTPVSSTSRPARRKRMNVEPGKSILPEDLATQPQRASSSKKQNKKNKKAKAPIKRSNRLSESESENDSDSSIPLSEDEDDPGSPTSVDHSDDEPIETETREEQRQLITCTTPPKVGDWVLVEYEALKKKQAHYVGFVTELEEDEEVIVTVNFLKKKEKSEGFLKPAVPDIDTVTLQMIKVRLDPPKEVAVGSRKSYMFSEDLSQFRFV